MEPVTQTIIFGVILVAAVITYELRIRMLNKIIESKDREIDLLRSYQWFNERHVVPFSATDCLNWPTPPTPSADNTPCD